MILGPLAAKLGLGVGAALSVALIATGLWGMHQKSKREAVTLEFAQYREAAASATALASENYRRLEQALFAKVKEAQDALDKERKAHARIAADLHRTRTERDGLRDQISGYASGGSAPDSVASARERAATLARLLGESLRLQEELAGDAEALAADVRALQAGWPH